MRTVADPRFTLELRARLITCGRSQNNVADAAHVSRSYLSQLVNGARTPSVEVARALDETLHADGALTALVHSPLEDVDADTFTVTVGGPVTDASVVALGRLLDAQRHLEDTVGTAPLLKPVDVQLEQITAMVMRAHGPIRPRLLLAAGQWAQFAGWLNLSAGRWKPAEQWLHTARQWATEADDPDLEATVVSYQAHAAWLQVDPRATVGLAKAALRDVRVYPGQRAYDAYQAARGHARLGDLEDAYRFVGFGDELAEQNAAWTGAIPAWEYYRERWLCDLERGLVWLEAARHDSSTAQRAVDCLERGVAGVPADMQAADWFAEYVVHLARAHRRAGDLEQAATALERAGRIAAGVGSKRIGHQVTVLGRTLFAERCGKR